MTRSDERTSVESVCYFASPYRRGVIRGPWAEQSPAVPNWLGQTEDGCRGALFPG